MSGLGLCAEWVEGEGRCGREATVGGWCSGHAQPTIEGLRESIRLMGTRLEGGQGTLASAMCRLSLPQSEVMLSWYDTQSAELAHLREEVAQLKASGARPDECGRCSGEGAVGSPALVCPVCVGTGRRVSVEEIARLRAENERLTTELAGLRSLVCAFCAEEYSHGDQEQVVAHMRTCAKHPLRSMMDENERLRAALGDVVQADDDDPMACIESIWDIASRALAAKPGEASACPDEGDCHGAMAWCEQCGDVRTLCSNRESCDVHRPCEGCGEPWERDCNCDESPHTKPGEGGGR